MLKDKEGMNNPYLLANPLTWLFDNIEDDLAWRDNQGPVLDILNYYHYLSHDGVRLHSQLKAFSEQLEEKYTVCNIVTYQYEQPNYLIARRRHIMEW